MDKYSAYVATKMTEPHESLENWEIKLFADDVEVIITTTNVLQKVLVLSGERATKTWMRWSTSKCRTLKPPRAPPFESGLEGDSLRVVK